MKDIQQVTENPIDIAYLKSIIDNDIEFKKELFTIFCENVKRNIAKMEDALESSNNNSWYMAAHAFKGSAASIGAFNLSKIMEYAQKNPEESRDKKIEILKIAKEESKKVIDYYTSEMLND